LTPERIALLDQLLIPKQDTGRTQLYRLRQHTMFNTPAALLDALEKFTLLQQWAWISGICLFSIPTARSFLRAWGENTLCKPCGAWD
jgi:hypothetical protein